ncbi:MAG TPA: hypothetical protein VKU86_00045 [Acidimicrobiales bacterium]|nr:hypothetical protein [Acidimicrobiales bacterium]
MRGESDDWVEHVSNAIHAAVVEKAAREELAGPFTLDDFLTAWLERENDTVTLLPDPPGSPDASLTERRSFWFYEGCQALENSGSIAEVGDGKFAVASLGTFVAQLREEVSQD